MQSRHMRQPLSSPMAGRPQAPAPQAPQGLLATSMAGSAMAVALAAIAGGVHITWDRSSGCGVSVKLAAGTASLLVSRGVCLGVAGMPISQAQASEESFKSACGSCGESTGVGMLCGTFTWPLTCSVTWCMSSSTSPACNVGTPYDLACSGDGRVAILEEPGQSGVEVPSSAELEAAGDVASSVSGSG